MRTIFLLLVMSLSLVAVACGGGEKGVAPGAGEGVSDEAYLEVLCTGSQNFSAALIAQSTPEQLRAVITAYADEMEATTPPRDVSAFHKEYVAYLREAVNQPVLLANGTPPMPPQPARGRLASKENSVEACKEPIYFGEDGDS